MFNLFLSKLEIESKEIDIDEPQLPRAKKLPNDMKLAKVLLHILTLLSHSIALSTFKPLTLLSMQL